jgi:hypothetical protein
MPLQSGLSHAGSGVLTVLLGAYLSAHSDLLRTFSVWIGGIVTTVLGVPLSQRVAGVLVVMAAVMFLWGVGYHYTRHGVGNSDTRSREYF